MPIIQGNKYWTIIKPTFQLISSGFLTAIVLTVISHKTYIPFEKNLRLFIIDYQIWLTLGITIIKVGMDQTIFIRTSKDGNYNYNIQKFILNTLVLNILFVFVFSFYNTFIISLFLSVTLLFDLKSIILISDFNGRKNINPGVIANLIRNFLPYLLICLFYSQVNSNIVSLIILTSSIMRFLFLNRKKNEHKHIKNNEIDIIKIEFPIIFQQLLNFLLFKIDSIYISINRKLDISNISQDDLNTIYSYQRLPDIISGIATTLSPILLPFIFNLKSTKYNRNKFAVFFFLGLIILTCVSYLFLYLFEINIGYDNFISLIINVNLIFIINYFTFELISKDKINKLLLILIISCLTGGLFLTIISMGGEINNNIFYVVPLQFMVFMIFRKII